MANTNQSVPRPEPPLVRPGERAVLLSHPQYLQARAIGQGLDDYDILMRQPDDVGPEEGERSEQERWMPVPANKYLKHRAIGWREAESLDDLPEEYRKTAADGGTFPPAQPRKRGGR